MKKLIILLLAVLVVMPMTSYGFGFLNITDAQLTKLDASTFRLRVTYDWGGDILPGFISPTLLKGFPMPSLASFGITGPTGFNFFSQSSTNVFTGTGSNTKVFNTGNQYGFDFSVTDPLISTYSFLSQGQIQWLYPTQLGSGGYVGTGIAATENFSTQFTLPTDPSAVPEPASVVLLGLGLLGAFIFKQRK